MRKIMKAEDVVIGEKYVVTGGGEYPVDTVVTVVRPSLHKDVPELFAVTKQELYIPDKKILDYEAYIVTGKQIGRAHV